MARQSVPSVDAHIHVVTLTYEHPSEGFLSGLSFKMALKMAPDTGFLPVGLTRENEPTVDMERRQKPWNDDSPVNTNKQWKLKSASCPGSGNRRRAHPPARLRSDRH